MTRMHTLIWPALLVVGLALGACGDDVEPADQGVPVGATGPGISILEARRSELDEPLLVNGFLVATGQDVRLCEALAESFPPQCGGASLTIQGLNLAGMENLKSEGAVSWTDAPIQILGTVDDGTLTVVDSSMPSSS